MNASDFQAGKTVVVNRQLLKPAPYNPQERSPEEQRRIQQSLKHHKYVERVVYNYRTMHIVSGHGRLEELDKLLKTQDYELEAVEIDVDEQQEAELNLCLNNPYVRGDYNAEKVASLFKTKKPRIERTGFTTAEVIRHFGLECVEDQPDKLEEVSEQVKAAQEAMEKASSNAEARDDPEFFHAVIYPSSAIRELVSEALGIADTRFIDGMLLVRLLRDLGKIQWEKEDE